MIAEFTHLEALDPPQLAGLNAAVRQICASTLGLPALPAGAEPNADSAVVLFAEQFSADVAALTVDQRAGFLAATGDQALQAVALVFIADDVPRVRAGLAALGVALPDPQAGGLDGDPANVLLNEFAPTVARRHILDPVTSEIIRLRGAAQHHCRLCRSLRDGTALDAGGSETLYDDIDEYQTSTLLTDAHKAALTYVDALIWMPSRIPAEVADQVLAYFSVDQAVEITFDVMRNACNKIAVAFGADTPRVTEGGTERYHIGADGHPVYRQKSSSV